MAMFLVVGCQTTQSAETETKPEVVKEVQMLPKEKEAKKIFQVPKFIPEYKILPLSSTYCFKLISSCSFKAHSLII